MLKTPPKRAGRDPILNVLTSLSHGKTYDGLDEGYASLSHWNPEFEYSFDKSFEPIDFMKPEYAVEGRTCEWTGEQMFLSDYGVIDTIEQFDEMFGEALRNDERTFFVTFVEIARKDQPASGGWRYHKWGPYFGTQNPKHEYIYHDTHIDRVFTFSIHLIEAEQVTA